MADEEKKKVTESDQSVGEEETTEDTEHKFDPDSDACGVCGGCGQEENELIGYDKAGLPAENAIADPDANVGVKKRD